MRLHLQIPTQVLRNPPFSHRWESAAQLRQTHRHAGTRGPRGRGDPRSGPSMRLWDSRGQVNQKRIQPMRLEVIRMRLEVFNGVQRLKHAQAQSFAEPFKQKCKYQQSQRVPNLEDRPNLAHYPQPLDGTKNHPTPCDSW